MMKPWAQIVFGLVAGPLSIGMGVMVQAFFPGMPGPVAGVIGGAVTLPLLAILVGAARS